MKVRYRSDPSNSGWVISISGETARVFIDGSAKLVPVAELEPVPGVIELSPEDLRVALTQRRLEHPATDQFLSYRASRTRLLYHQFLPVKKMLESPDQRLLIADEVGTGKTIEAGLIWAELESRSARGLENVWIVCPKSLVGKWQEEMLQRFDLRLELLSSENIRQALVLLRRDGVLPPRFARSIVNLELIRMEDHVVSLGESAIAWDLTIFDEAHHLRNTDTLSHIVAQLICERSRAAVFLTATPLQTHLRDIVHLMEALGVDVAEDPELLEEQLHWDMRLNDWISLVRRRPPGWRRDSERSLDRLAADGGRTRPGWAQFRQLVVGSDIENRRQRTLVLDAARDLQALSPYMTRTLRSEVDERRPTREAGTRVVKFSPEEDSFYQGVYQICSERALAHGVPSGFITQMPERRTASCVPAVASEILSYSNEDEDDEFEASFTPSEVSMLEPLARAALQSKDRKLEALLEMLEQVIGDLKADRVMIFSTFRGTLRYLAEKLRENGYSLEVLYGPTPMRDEDSRQGEKSRERIAAEFRGGEFQVLLASEVAGEGLDFEHCHVVINYDLPWNPMRVEQRIGRCDRIGQVSDKVYIRSLSSEGTIESRILSRLYERLGIFERALGDLEVVLGETIASFERDLFRRGLTPQQQEERLEQTAQAIENNEQYRDLISRASVISEQGRHLIESEQQEIKDSEARFLSPTELSEYVRAVLDRRLPDSLRKAAADGQFDVVRNSELLDGLQGLVASYPPTHHARTEIVRFRSRIERDRRLRVSFLGEDEGVEFVHGRHPLMLLARNLERGPLSDVPWCTGTVPPDMLDRPTMLVWAIGSLEGYANRAELLCASIDCRTESVSPIPVELAQKLIEVTSAPTDGLSSNGFDVEILKSRAEEVLLSEFRNVTAAFRARDSLLTEKAKSAVRSHSQRQLTRNDRQLSRNDLNIKLRSMYDGWNRRIQDETESKLADIDRRSGIRSSLEVIGAAIIYPETHRNGAAVSTSVLHQQNPKALLGRDRDRIRILGDIVSPMEVEWEAESDPDRVLNP